MFMRRWPVYDRVIVNLTDGSALDGLLVDQRGPLLVLSDATLLARGHEPTAMDGEVYVERDRVLFLQRAQPKGG